MMWYIYTCSKILIGRELMGMKRWLIRKLAIVIIAFISLLCIAGLTQAAYSVFGSIPIIGWLAALAAGIGVFILILPILLLAFIGICMLSVYILLWALRIEIIIKTRKATKKEKELWKDQH